MEYLVSKGLKFGTRCEGDIHRTYSNVKTYYLTETPYALKLLSKEMVRGSVEKETVRAVTLFKKKKVL